MLNIILVSARLSRYLKQLASNIFTSWRMAIITDKKPLDVIWRTKLTSTKTTKILQNAIARYVAC
jgi:hypothetical protein